MSTTISHVIGFDDSPFARDHRGDVVVVGAVFAALRLEGVLTGKVRRDGANSTQTLVRLVSRSRFAAHSQLIMLQGIAFAGFNVIDIHALNEALAKPVLVVARRQPDLAGIKKALLGSVPGGKRKWRLVERGKWIRSRGSISSGPASGGPRPGTSSNILRSTAPYPNLCAPHT